jgi:outer membrane lipopolysaccharide assembly protein LptE/RlpB
MQNDIVQQLMRRLAAFKPVNVEPLAAPLPATATE